MDAMYTEMGYESAGSFEAEVGAGSSTAAAGTQPSNIPWYVAAAQNGDPDGFRVLYRTHRATVQQLVRRMMKNGPEVDDTVQEVFLQVHRSLAGFRGQSQFNTWLFRVVYNVTAMHFRAKRSRPVLCAIDPERTDPAAPSDADNCPHQALVRRQRLAQLAASVGKLSAPKREAFLMHDMKGLHAEEISALTSAPLLTVRSRLFAARQEIMASMSRRAA